MAETRDDLFSGPGLGDDLSRSLALVASAWGFLQGARGLLDRTAEAVAHAEQPGGHRCLERLGRAVVGEARGDRAGRQAVLDQGDRERVEHDRLVIVREAALQLQEGDVAE